ncbi:MAG: T9SS type A sorting domain-containing protein, partial [Bacteroidia bacterium]|nr:T9SS type A sorting domain-containing protein [Bacteroidia bacterium]
KFDDGREEFYHLATDPSESDDLLDGALTANETLNYNYLCGEMNTLLGNTNYCNIIIRIDEHTLFNHPAFPNPFQSHISVTSDRPQEWAELMNEAGQSVYSGYEIEKQDFTHLPSGIYLLKYSGDFIRLVKK